MTVENERIARLESVIETFEKGFDRLESKLDFILENFDKKYIPRTEHEQVIKRLEEQIRENDKKFKSLEVKQSRNFNLTITSIVAVLVAIVQTWLRK